MMDTEFQHLDGAQTRDHLSEIQEVYHAAFPDYDLGDHKRRTLRQAESRGFEAVTARDDGQLIGFVYGLPLTQTSTWWRELDPPQPEAFTAETGSRTFAVIDLAVLPERRRRGLGRRLMDELLGARGEDRATLATAPSDREVQRMYERWGWEKIGRIPGSEGTTEPVFELYVIALR